MRTPVLKAGARDCFWANASHVWRGGMPEVAQRQTPTIECQVNFFYERLPPRPWIPTVEIFVEQLSRVVTADVQKFGSNNVDLKSIAEMSHCVFKASPATFSRVDVTVGQRRKDSVRFKIIFPPQTLRPCARVCLFVRHKQLCYSVQQETKTKRKTVIRFNQTDKPVTRNSNRTKRRTSSDEDDPLSSKSSLLESVWAW